MVRRNRSGAPWLLTCPPLSSAGDFDLKSERLEFVGFTPLAGPLADVDAVVTVGGRARSSAPSLTRSPWS